MAVGGGAALLGLAAGCNKTGANPSVDGGPPYGSDATTGASDSSAGDHDGADQGIATEAGYSQDAAPEAGASDVGADGGPVVLVDGLTNPSYVAVDATRVYFVAGTDSGAIESVMTVPIAGGSPSALASTTALVRGLAVYEGVVYFTTGNSVMSVPADGGTAVPVATGETSAVGPAVNADGLFWSDAYDGGAIRTISLEDGSAPDTVATDQSYPTGLAVNASGLAWMTLGGISWLPFTPDAGPVALAASATSNNGDIALDDSAVYSPSNCGIYRSPLDGGPGALLGLLVPPIGGVCVADLQSIAVDPAGVYLPIETMFDPTQTVLSSGGVVRFPLDGGAYATIAADQNAPNNVAVDGTNVYWTNHGINGLPGQVMKAPKPAM
jgi:hypothetical protein